MDRVPPKAPKVARQKIVATQTETCGVVERANARAANPAAFRGLGWQTNSKRPRVPWCGTAGLGCVIRGQGRQDDRGGLATLAGFPWAAKLARAPTVPDPVQT